MRVQNGCRDAVDCFSGHISPNIVFCVPQKKELNLMSSFPLVFTMNNDNSEVCFHCPVDGDSVLHSQ